VINKFNPGDLVRIKSYCKMAGQVGIITKSYYGMEHDLFMSSGQKIRALEMNIEVTGESQAYF
jgi:hypothetical protein|tara:strand:- start:882 stop:1070 length:189 start_codon:yes stop_codon:yes gene_type:complete